MTRASRNIQVEVLRLPEDLPRDAWATRTSPFDRKGEIQVGDVVDSCVAELPDDVGVPRVQVLERCVGRHIVCDNEAIIHEPTVEDQTRKRS
eukprot:6556659-Alexandrium_andersonii.AAC.1